MKYIKNVLFISFVIILCISCQPQNKITQEEAKSLCEKVELIYSNADAETAKEILDSSYVLYSPFLPMGSSGIETLMYNVKSNKRSFPDFSLKVDSFFVKGDVIYSYWTQKGTNTGPLGRMPTTGKSINISGFAISRVKNGKIIEEHTYWNVFEFYQQLGFKIVHPDFQDES